MPYTFPSGQPIRTGPNGELLGGTYTPPGQESLAPQVEGDPEQVKEIANMLGMPGLANLVDQFQSAGETSSNITALAEGISDPRQVASTIGDLANEAVTDFTDQLPTDPGFITGAIKNVAQNKLLGLFGGGGLFGSHSLPMPNELEQFASMNCIFGLGCISPNELNFPDRTYRKSGIVNNGQVVLKSGKTPLGKPQTYAEKYHQVNGAYYIDEVNIDTTVAPNPKSRSTNFYGLSFQVYEPYSMGQFLQTLQLAAKNAGYNNYLEAPYLLTLDFVGWDNDGNQVSPSRPIRRMFPLKFVTCNFTVNGEGSKYDITCSVFNDDAFLDANQSIPVNMSVSGSTLQEICQTGLNSIATHWNTHLLNRRNETREKTEVDEYIIAFPGDGTSARLNSLIASGSLIPGAATTGELERIEFDEEAIQTAFATVDTTLAAAGYQQDNSDFGARIIEQQRAFIDDRLGYSVRRGRLSESIKATVAGRNITPNRIGSSPILTAGPLGAGRSPFGIANFAWDPVSGLLKRGGVTIDPKLRTITFRAGTKLQKILEELVLLSEFGKSVTQQLNRPDGMVDWFKIEAQVYLVNDAAAEKVMGRMPRIYLYRVVPYRVHRSAFQMPNDVPPGFDKLYSQAPKVYNYMFTGKNTDVLNFDIKFDNAFYESISLDRGNRSGSNQPSEQSNTKTTPNLALQGNSRSPQGDGTTVVEEPQNLNTVTGGATTEDPRLRLARSFNEAIVNSGGDLISIELEVLGDPFYIADSGTGNYNSAASPSFNVNRDGTMNHQNGEVDIIINFRTPIDLDPDNGGYLMDGASIGLQDYSGLYKIIEVTNRFSGNVFTQTIQAVRRRNQQNARAGAQVTDAMLEEEQRHQRRIAEAELNGTPEEVAFARADVNGDGVLQYWEVPNLDEATRITTARNENRRPTNNPTAGTTPGGATASGATGDGLRGSGTTTTTPTTTPTTTGDGTTSTTDQPASPPAPVTVQPGVFSPLDVYFDYSSSARTSNAPSNNQGVEPSPTPTNETTVPERNINVNDVDQSGRIRGGL